MELKKSRCILQERERERKNEGANERSERGRKGREGRKKMKEEKKKGWAEGRMEGKKEGLKDVIRIKKNDK